MDLPDVPARRAILVLHLAKRGRDPEKFDLATVAEELAPLYRTCEEQIKVIREWARGRAQTAGREAAVVELFRRVEG